MHWKTKAGIFRLLSTLPCGEQLHYLLQRHVTREWPRRPAHLDELLLAARRLQADARARIDLADAHFVEIGAGRDLAVAAALRLLGVGRVTCIDIAPLARPDLVAHAVRHMARRLGKDAPSLRTWDDVRAFGLDYRAPTDLQRAALPAGSVDCFYSVDTLEHIPRARLQGLFSEVRRILRPGGLSVQFIDYGDHYARGQPLSAFNFLAYSEAGWAPYNSSLQYVNRMRHSEYLAMFSAAGLRTVTSEEDVEAHQADILARLDPGFRGFEQDDLFTIRAKIVLQPA